MTAKTETATVLLLEDQALIAIYVEELLHQAGFDSVNTISSCGAAERWLSSNMPAFAIIETRLRDGDCDDIARMLEQRKVPYIIHTAYGRSDFGRPETMKTRPWLSKPCDADDFIAAIGECVPVRADLSLTV